MSDGLKPCPFCGADVAEICTCEELQACDARCDICPCPKTYQVVCSWDNYGCGASSGVKDTREEAANAWNHRVGDAR